MTTTGGDSIAASLRAHGVDTVFGIPGAQLYGLFDAFQRDGMRVITPRHEQTCAYMAFGYARASGNPGVYSVVPGPGVLNTGAALLTAWGCNEPVLCLTGQVPTAFLGKGRGHLHEMRDQRAVLAGIVKSAERAERAGDVSAAIAHAFREMRSLKPGPATIEMPWEQFTMEDHFEVVRPLQNHPDPVADVAIGEAAAVIGRAERPIIFVGPGAFEARDEVLQLAERLHAPVVAFRSGRGVVSNRHELGLTIAEARKLWPTVDCVIGIGTRLEVPSLALEAEAGGTGHPAGDRRGGTDPHAGGAGRPWPGENLAQGAARRDQTTRCFQRLAGGDPVRPRANGRSDQADLAALRLPAGDPRGPSR